MVGHVEELFSGNGDFSFAISSFDIEEDSTQNIDSGVAGTIDIGIDWEEVMFTVTQPVDSGKVGYV